MDLIRENIPAYTLINDFIQLKDIINLSMVSKKFYRYKYKNNSIKNRSSYIIYNFIKRFLFNKFRCNSLILFDSPIVTPKIIASYYFTMYNKKYINSWYNMNTGWKKNIIDSYNPKKVDNPTRLDLFNLMIRMEVGDIYAIGM